MGKRDTTEDMALDEAFELIQHLGTGGFAHTYEARVLDKDLIDEFQSEVVALKIPLNRTKARQLKHEIQMNGALYLHLKEIESVNLVKCLGFESFRGQVVMVMEHVKGGSLRDMLGMIGSKRRLPYKDALGITMGVLRGLEVVHQANFFHRDIKPENILLEDGNAKIADLGISRLLQADELASSYTGTVFYMSPESLSMQGASFPADIWSMGVTLYEMLTGRLPFCEFDTPIGTVVDHIRSKEPIPVCDMVEDIPAGFEDVLVKALAKDPEDRFVNAAEMIEALRKLEKPDNSELEQELAAAQEMIRQNERDEIIERKLHSIMAEHPDNPIVCQHMGEFYNRCEKFNKAIQAFKKGIRQDPENGMLHWDLALSYQKIGKKQAAVKNLSKAMSMDLDPSIKRHAKILMKSVTS